MSNETNNNEYLLKVDHLKQYFPVHDGFKKMELKAVDDVSFAIKPGETLGLVGESGCGKTTVGRTLLRLYQPTAGRIEFDGNVLFDSEEKIDVDMHPYRKQMQMVFQEMCIRDRVCLVEWHIVFIYQDDYLLAVMLI